MIPFLKIPTNTDGFGNSSVEGGLSVPFQATLSHGFSLGLQSGVNLVRNETGAGYQASFVNALLISHSLGSDKLSAFGEFFSTVGTQSPHAGYVDTGVVYQIFPNATIDLGCYFGVTSAAPEFQPFTGFSFRF